MSERGAPAPPQTPIPSLPSTNGAFDGLVRDLLSIMAEMVQGQASTMATVTGRSGGGVIVHIDGEEISRQLPFARKKGVRYSDGARVALKRTRSGEFIVDGLVSSDPYEVAIYGEQIDPAVMSRVNNAVQSATLTSYYTKAQADNLFLEEKWWNNTEFPEIQKIYARLCALEGKAGLAKGRCS